MSSLSSAPEGILYIGLHMLKGSVFYCARGVVLFPHKEPLLTHFHLFKSSMKSPFCSGKHLRLIFVFREKGGWKRKRKITLTYCIDPNHISHQASAPLFLCMNMDVEQHPHRLCSTGLCKTSDSSYLLHHRLSQFNISLTPVAVCVCGTSGAWV